jgi:phage regulator Rha-like protein
MNHTELPNKTALVIHGKNNQIIVDSRDLAKEFGRDHKNVLQTLDDLLADGTISRLESKPSDYYKRGKEYRCYELNKAGFLKAMPFMGGRKSREGQRRLVDAFLEQESKLERQSKEREKFAYQIARLSGKDSRAILTEVIQKFIVYATRQGSGSADRYYCIITKLVYQALISSQPKASSIRELLTAIQLSHLSTIELTAAQALDDDMQSGVAYKVIYQRLKSTLNGFSGFKSALLEG